MAAEALQISSASSSSSSSSSSPSPSRHQVSAVSSSNSSRAQLRNDHLHPPNHRENPNPKETHRDRGNMKESREAAAVGPTKYPEKSRVPDRVRGSDRSNVRLSSVSVSSSEDDSLGVSPFSGHGNQSSEREPGELSSGSIPEDPTNLGLDEEKSSIRVSSKHGSTSIEKESNHESRLSLSPVQKKRKFTPIVWDLDEKASEKTSAASLPLPLPVTLPLPPPPPLTLTNPKQHQNADQRTSQITNVPKKQLADQRNSPMTNVSREAPLNISARISSTPPNISSRISSTPPKSSSELTLTPPKISSTAPALAAAKPSSVEGLKTTQISLTRTRIETSSRGSSYTPSPEHSLSSLKTTQISVTKTRIVTLREGSYTPSPERTTVSPFDAENNVESTKENAHRRNVVQSPENSQGSSPVHAKDVDMDMDHAPRINIATSRWAEENTPSRDDTVAVIAGKSKSLSTESDEGGRLSTDEEGGRDGEDSMSPEPGEYIKDKHELGETGGSNVAKDYDGNMSDEYERDLNNRELMELDKDTNDDSEEEERPEVDSEEGEAPAVAVPPQRLIDMLQGCRSVDEYERLNKIDEGTYGVVYRARDKKTGEIVALKKVKMEKEREGFPMTSLREINVLLSIHHRSIVDVKEVVVGSNLDSIFMVMEYMEHDLKGLMESIKQPFSQSEVKCLMLQLFEGVKHLHDNWVLHRDLKTSNLLLNNRGELKICDFGLARQYGSPLKTYTHMVVTLWYRAPELLLGCKQYSTAVDMWSLGCIMAEFLAKEPLFNGKNELDQLDKIFKTLGTPNETIWPDFSKLPGVKCNFVKQPFNRLREKFPPTAFAGRPPLSENGFNLLNRLLLYDPKKRITAEEALNHEWFKEVPLPKMKELMPTYPARSEQDRRSRRLMKSPDPLLEQRKRELRHAELGSGGLFG